MTEVPPSDAVPEVAPSGTEDEKITRDESKFDGWEESEIQEYTEKKRLMERFANRMYDRQCQVIIGIMRENARQQNWTATQTEEAEENILQANTERKYPMFEPKRQRNI